MKKNKMMRLASSLLVAVLLTTSVISGTFAKYTTSGNATDSARVAKWGVQIAVAGGDTGVSDEGMFKTTYTIEETGTTLTNAVKSTSDEVIAPGTDGSLGSVTITGTTEVGVKVNTVATLTLTGWTVDSSEYCPLVFTVGTETFKIDGTTITSIAGLISAVENAVEVNQYFEPNADLSSVNRTVAWDWPFETGADQPTKDANNLKDTALGKEGTASITFEIVTTVEQVD